MKKLTVWLGALIIAASMTVPGFAARLPDGKKGPAGTAGSQIGMIVVLEPFPWETSDGGLLAP